MFLDVITLSNQSILCQYLDCNITFAVDALIRVGVLEKKAYALKGAGAYGKEGTKSNHLGYSK